ncbi:hypothetical protein [Paracidovorax citrulli]
MNKREYLGSRIVKGFAQFLSGVIDGTEEIGFSYKFHASKFSPDYRERFGLVGTAKTLETFFDRYYWKGKYYEETAKQLSEIQDALRGSLARDLNAIDAINHEVGRVMDWGLGERSRAAEANKNWAKLQRHRLPFMLRAGAQTLQSDDPEYNLFHREPDANGLSRVRMNSGFTKVYSLLCDGVIIYDSRVAAALCWLVRRYLVSIKHPGPVPNELAFICPPGQTAQNRNASGDGYVFRKSTKDAEWARANVHASWLLEEARIHCGATWCSGPEGLRKLECALFMLGYGLPASEAGQE